MMLSVYRIVRNQQVARCVSTISGDLKCRKLHVSSHSLNASNMTDLKSLLNKAKNDLKEKKSDGGFNRNRGGKDHTNSDFKGNKDKERSGDSFGKNKYGNKNHGREDNKGGEFKRDNNKIRELKNEGGDRKSFSKSREHGGKGDYKNKKNYRRDYDGPSRQEQREEQKKKLLFLDSGNDRDRDAAKRIISDAIKENGKGIVQVIKEGGVIEIVNVINAFEGIKLSEKGIVIVGNKNVKEEDEDKHGLEVGQKIPVLKIVDRQLAIKQYGDFLNEQVVEKLKAQNSNILGKQLKNKKDDNGKGELKVVQIGWNINLNDLTGQKKFEIENHLKKGSDVDIVFDERESLDKENSSHNSNSSTATDAMFEGEDGKEAKEDDSGEGTSAAPRRRRRKELNDAEMAMRNKMVGIIEENLQGLEGLPESSVVRKGIIEGRTVIRVKGIVRKDKVSKENKREQKQAEKALKAEKNRLRQQEKERLAREQMKELVV